MSRCNTAAITAHLAEISNAAADTLSVVLLDQAGWHTAQAIEVATISP